MKVDVGEATTGQAPPCEWCDSGEWLPPRWTAPLPFTRLHGWWHGHPVAISWKKCRRMLTAPPPRPQPEPDVGAIRDALTDARPGGACRGGLDSSIWQESDVEVHAAKLYGEMETPWAEGDFVDQKEQEEMAARDVRRLVTALSSRSQPTVEPDVEALARRAVCRGCFLDLPTEDSPDEGLIHRERGAIGAFYNCDADERDDDCRARLERTRSLLKGVAHMLYIGSWQECVEHSDSTGHTRYTHGYDSDLWWCDDCPEEWEEEEEAGHGRGRHHGGPHHASLRRQLRSGSGRGGDEGGPHQPAPHQGGVPGVLGGVPADGKDDGDTGPRPGP